MSGVILSLPTKLVTGPGRKVADLRHIGTSLGLERLARLCDQLLGWMFFFVGSSQLPVFSA